MTSQSVRIVLAEYARRIRAGRGTCVIQERVYACEASILEGYRWIRCVRVNPISAGEAEGTYRVSLTRLGVREASAIRADMGRRQRRQPRRDHG